MEEGEFIEAAMLELWDATNKKQLNTIKSLEQQLKECETMRPHWAEGYTSDSVAAQVSAAALSKLWELLGVKNQTEAIAEIKSLKHSEKTLQALEAGGVDNWDWYSESIHDGMKHNLEELLKNAEDNGYPVWNQSPKSIVAEIVEQNGLYEDEIDQAEEIVAQILKERNKYV